jgi:hypothetical protein
MWPFNKAMCDVKMPDVDVEDLMCELQMDGVRAVEMLKSLVLKIENCLQLNDENRSCLSPVVRELLDHPASV